MPSRLSRSQVDAVLTRMGYSRLNTDGQYVAYTDGDSTRTVFLSIADDIPLKDVQEQLEAHGLNMDAFHAFLEGL